MAPGGLLDAGSRLTQTLMTVPFERERMRLGHEEKALGREREDQRIQKTDRIGYLRDRINATGVRMKELQGAIESEDANAIKSVVAEARATKGQGLGLPDEVQKDIHSIDEALRQHEIKLRQDMLRNLDIPEGTTPAKKAELEAAWLEKEIAPSRESMFNEHKKRYKDAYAAAAAVQQQQGGMAFNSKSSAAARKDPKLKQEMMALADEQTQLYDQYRRLVGHAEDITKARAIAESVNAPEFGNDGSMEFPVRSAPGPAGSPVPGKPSADTVPEPGPGAAQKRLADNMNVVTNPDLNALAVKLSATVPRQVPPSGLVQDLEAQYAARTPQAIPEPGRAEAALGRLDVTALADIAKRYEQEKKSKYLASLPNQDKFSRLAASVLAPVEGAPIPHEQMLRMMADGSDGRMGGLAPEALTPPTPSTADIANSQPVRPTVPPEFLRLLLMLQRNPDARVP